MPLVNRIWKRSCREAKARFTAASHDLKHTQWTLLQSILAKNAYSLYGREYGLDKIRSWEEFWERVPQVEYSDLSPWIDKIAAGENGILTTEKVLLLEPTSGSSSAAKLIPYTVTLRNQFQEGIKAWIWDLFSGDPELMNGRSYWSISPPTLRDQNTKGGVKIGFQTDAEYLGGWERRAMNHIMAVPSSVLDSEDYMKRSAQYLRDASDLRLISVWNPSFMEVLLEYLDDDPKELWPKLGLLSCWGDASAKAPMSRLAEKFPGVSIQPKGLLSTEGFTSIPLVGHRGSALCGHCHVFEFEGANGDLLLAHQLEVGSTYEVILTTGGGLYRYRSNDLVAMLGHFNQLPLFEFVGRKGGVVDIHGEKLHPEFVEQVFENVREQFRLPEHHFLFLAPGKTRRHYTLYIDRCEINDSLAAASDNFLSQNPHYRYCREIGQLDEIQVVKVDRGETLLLKNGPQLLGIRPGDMKPMPIHSSNRWEEVFTR